MQHQGRRSPLDFPLTFADQSPLQVQLRIPLKVSADYTPSNAV
jgi:hypothetical protein